ncbi:MAG: DAK2 domain-containing protein [Clostridia bacterium]|nr:DAK2 domain-containing protein [Clostridia bacterium]MDY3725001.1 DAK2 domain-containing protein [Christensenellaceae bacterium]
MQKNINGAIFAKMVISASKLLDVNREQIDTLNVFPVPDGDTGTNMSLTMQSAIKELRACKSNALPDLADAVSKGALKGARGNSGVITSQIFRGICSVLKDYTEADTRALAKGLKAATDIAYGAVSKPKEGTILTVCRMVSEHAQSICGKNKDIESFLTEIINKAEEAVQLTPTLLPVLKKAGVVDSGGMGLLTIYRGMYKGLIGEEIEGAAAELPEVKVDSSMEHADILNLGTIEFGYCTEFFVINLKKKTTLADIDRLKEYLMTIGDCVLVIGDLEFIKVHVHTNNPDKALSKALQLGEIDKIKIENMLEENRELIKKYEAEKKEMGMLSICSGTGLADIFKDLNCDRVIEGGQTMNPSAQDIADAIIKINAENVFVFPNNKNIILAAEQSKSLVEGKKINVVPTKSIPQGISAALAFNPEVSADENLINMLHAIDNVTSGQVTYAVRTTKVDGFSLNKGDIIGLDNKKILAHGKDIATVTAKLIDKLRDQSHSLINLYYGSDVTEEDASALQAKIQETYPDLDVELFFGGQAIYYYIVSLE